MLCIFGVPNHKDMKKYLIGGARMVELGSDRRTNDIDFLINEKGRELFTHEGDVDYINAAAHPFYAAIWEAAQTEGITAQLMFEMKAFSLVQHCQNRNFAKVATTEYDLRRLFLDHDTNTAPIARRHMTAGEYNEVLNTLKF